MDSVGHDAAEGVRRGCAGLPKLPKPDATHRVDHPTASAQPMAAPKGRGPGARVKRNRASFRPSSPASKSNPNRHRLLERFTKLGMRITRDHRGLRKLCLSLDPGRRRAYQQAGTRLCQHLGTRNYSATTHLALLFQPGPRPKFRGSPTRANQMRLFKTLYTSFPFPHFPEP